MSKCCCDILPLKWAQWDETNWSLSPSMSHNSFPFPSVRCHSTLISITLHKSLTSPIKECSFKTGFKLVVLTLNADDDIKVVMFFVLFCFAFFFKYFRILTFNVKIWNQIWKCTKMSKNKYGYSGSGLMGDVSLKFSVRGMSPLKSQWRTKIGKKGNKERKEKSRKVSKSSIASQQMGQFCGGNSP